MTEDTDKKRSMSGAERQQRHVALTKQRKSVNFGREKCYSCGHPLRTHAERMIGTHIGCVAEAKFDKVTIPRPKYGRQQPNSQRREPGPRIRY